jgi:hypothetical protein
MSKGELHPKENTATHWRPTKSRVQIIRNPYKGGFSKAGFINSLRLVEAIPQAASDLFPSEN